MVLWIELHHLQIFVEVLTPVPQNVIFFEGRVFRGNLIKMRWIEWAQVHMAGVLINRGHLDTETCL